MTRKAVYRETVSGLSVAEFKTLLDAVESWASGSPNHAAPTVRRNVDTGDVEIEIQISGIPNDQLEAKLTALDQAATNLPGNWPAPSDNADFKLQ